ncbi:MAG: hypothetical protein IJ682_05930 [Lachnospiraceae bacterium]|nr:hypothetical protein [Lachnospiraceae bacterium]
MTSDAIALNDMSSIELLNDGVDILRKNFGDVKTEAFISLIIREKFDYTQWRRRFFGDKSVKEINADAVAYATEHPFVPKKELAPVKRG